jgi:hypothetical protein
MLTFIGLSSMWALSTPRLSDRREQFMLYFGRDCLLEVSWVPMPPEVS